MGFFRDNCTAAVRIGTDEMAAPACVGRRDVGRNCRSTARNDDVTTLCALRRSDDVIVPESREQRNVARKLLRVQHEQKRVSSLMIIFLFHF